MVRFIAVVIAVVAVGVVAALGATVRSWTRS